MFASISFIFGKVILVRPLNQHLVPLLAPRLAFTGDGDRDLEPHFLLKKCAKGFETGATLVKTPAGSIITQNKNSPLFSGFGGEPGRAPLSSLGGRSRTAFGLAF